MLTTVVRMLMFQLLSVTQCNSFMHGSRLIATQLSHRYAASAAVIQPHTFPEIVSTTVSFECLNNNATVSYKENETNKPPLLFLPGLDGLGDYSTATLQTLTEKYECWRMLIQPDDRSSFLTLVKLTLAKLDTFDEPVILLGESFGGVLASYLAGRFPKQISRLVLLNPATSIADTPWRSIAPLIASTGPLYPVVGISTLLASSIQPQQIFAIGERIAQEVRGLTDRQAITDKIMQELKPLTELPGTLPADTLVWRLKEWLDTGNFLAKDVLPKINIPTLLLIGVEDRLLPSVREGPRLQRTITRAFVELKMFPGRGHALLDRTFDLQKCLYDFELAQYRHAINDLSASIPSKEDLQLIDKQLAPLVSAVSPVFFSTDPSGVISAGLSQVPLGTSGRPVLLVGNHQLLGLDLALIVREFLREREVLIRGLAHPLIFNQSGPYLDTLRRFGAVKVSPMAYFQLLKQNETVMLFPGGANEALHAKGEEYKLIWPEKTDFVRMAGLMDAIIVPFAAVGMFDSMNILLDRDELQQLPIVGDFAKKFAERTPNARADINDSFVAPLVAPNLPSRNYFLFTQPIDTRSFDAMNKSECRRVYLGIRDDLQHTIDALREYGKTDPNRDFFPRILQERGGSFYGKKTSYPAIESLKQLVDDSKKSKHDHHNKQQQQDRAEGLGQAEVKDSKSSSSNSSMLSSVE